MLCWITFPEGVAIVEVPASWDPRQWAARAMRAAAFAGCNPGSAGQVVQVPDFAVPLIPEDFRGVLLSAEQVEQIERRVMAALEAPQNTRAPQNG